MSPPMGMSLEMSSSMRAPGETAQAVRMSREILWRSHMEFQRGLSVRALVSASVDMAAKTGSTTASASISASALLRGVPSASALLWGVPSDAAVGQQVAARPTLPFFFRLCVELQTPKKATHAMMKSIFIMITRAR